MKFQLVISAAILAVGIASASHAAEKLEPRAKRFEDNGFEMINADATPTAEPGDLYLRTASGKYIQLNDDNYAVITDNVASATIFGRMMYDKKTYYVANSGKYAGYYLSYSIRGYIGTYTWTNAVAWTQSKALCLTVDNGKGWKTYEYVSDKVKYVVIGDYSYTEECFLPVPASESYKAIKLQSKYANENAACTWQQTGGQCPPFVVYYTDSQSATLALYVQNGKLYQGNALFDTSKADASHSLAHTSIFVMDLNGNVYASKQFKVFLFHHSSILAGRDVAFAGEMQVENGVIKKVTNCSGHYLPPITLAQQLVDSLKKQGYAGDIKVDDCKPTLMDLNHKALSQ